MRACRPRAMLRLALCFATLPVAPAFGQPARCAFADWMTYADTPLRVRTDAGAYVYATSRKAVDADGAPNAYHPDDVGQTCGPVGTGLDCPANAGYPGADWWPTVLVPDPVDPGRAYEQASGEFAGFFVAKTALADGANPVAEDPAKYADARTVPYVVFPRPFYRLRGTGRLGDVGFALNLETGARTFFVVADIGPAEPLGEASIGFFTALGGQNVSARTGGGVPRGRIAYMIFPNSSRSIDLGWPIDAAALARVGQPLLDGVGGVAALTACFDP